MGQLTDNIRMPSFIPNTARSIMDVSPKTAELIRRVLENIITLIHIDG